MKTNTIKSALICVICGLFAFSVQAQLDTIKYDDYDFVSTYDPVEGFGELRSPDKGIYATVLKTSDGFKFTPTNPKGRPGESKILKDYAAVKEEFAARVKELTKGINETWDSIDQINAKSGRTGDRRIIKRLMDEHGKKLKSDEFLYLLANGNTLYLEKRHNFGSEETDANGKLMRRFHPSPFTSLEIYDKNLRITGVFNENIMYYSLDEKDIIEITDKGFIKSP